MTADQIIEQVTKKEPGSKTASRRSDRFGKWPQEIVIKLIVLGREEEARMFLNVMLGDDEQKRKGVISRYWADDELYTEEVNNRVEQRCQASMLTVNAPDTDGEEN